MDYNRDSGNIVHIVTTDGPRNVVDNHWGNQEVWATDDEYGKWDQDTNSNNNGRLSETRSGSGTPNKKHLGDLNGTTSRSKAIGKMFHKTKLCCKFRAGTCPYVTNCNFAHSVEELRKPPPNWQEIVAAHDEERAVLDEPREEYQIPSLGSSSFSVENQRSFKGRHCKKFFTEEGCPYGDSCTFLHDEQSRARESVVISLGPGSGGSYGGGGTPTAAGSPVPINSNVKPSNWKTRICNKWEQTGYCPFGSKCHFAHGAADAKDSGTLFDPSKPGTMVSKANADNIVVASTPLAANPDGHHVGVPSQRLPGVILRTGPQGLFTKWKGPDKISRIYGDWIDDIE